MKKTNWIILALALVVSLFLLWLWYFLRFNLVDNPLDLVLSIIWWCLIAVAIVVFTRLEKKRQERVRTAYVAPLGIFNAESGLSELEAGASKTALIEEILQGLKYNFHHEKLPEEREARFVYIVHSKKYKDDGDEWEGDVVVVSRPDDDPREFKSREELAAILGDPAPTAAA